MPKTDRATKIVDELLQGGGDQDARRRVYVAGCLAKMQRTGPCSRDFAFDCAEPITDEHILWADQVLASLDRLGCERGQ